MRAAAQSAPDSTPTPRRVVAPDRLTIGARAIDSEFWRGVCPGFGHVHCGLSGNTADDVVAAVAERFPVSRARVRVVTLAVVTSLAFGDRAITRRSKTATWSSSSGISRCHGGSSVPAIALTGQVFRTSGR